MEYFFVCGMFVCSFFLKLLSRTGILGSEKARIDETRTRMMMRKVCEDYIPTHRDLLRTIRQEVRGARERPVARVSCNRFGFKQTNGLVKAVAAIPVLYSA